MAAIVGPAEALMQSRCSSRESSWSARRAKRVVRVSGVGVEDIVVLNRDKKQIKY